MEPFMKPWPTEEGWRCITRHSSMRIGQGGGLLNSRRLMQPLEMSRLLPRVGGRINEEVLRAACWGAALELGVRATWLPH